jgi:integrase
VFTMRDGQSILPKLIRVRLLSICSAAGLPQLRVHDLRHMCASLLARLKVPPRTAMEILGHGDMRSTQMIYTHVYQDEKRTAVEVIADAIETPEPSRTDAFVVKIAV